MSKRPGAAEIQIEIDRLKKMKPKVKHYTFFGDDNWARIEAQIRVLDLGLNEDDIYDEWPGDDEMEIRSGAQDALAWIEGEGGEGDDPPSAGWKELME